VPDLRRLKRVRVGEISLVDRAANRRRFALLKADGSWKVGGARGLPLQDDTAWDGSAAEDEIRAWAGGEDDMDWGKLRRGFVLYDAGEPEKLGSYKMPFARVKDGKLVASRSGLQAVRNVLAGGRGGVQAGGAHGAAESFVNGYLGKPDGNDKRTTKGADTMPKSILDSVEQIFEEPVAGEDAAIARLGKAADSEVGDAGRALLRIAAALDLDDLRKLGFQKAAPAHGGGESSDDEDISDAVKRFGRKLAAATEQQDGEDDDDYEKRMKKLAAHIRRHAPVLDRVTKLGRPMSPQGDNTSTDAVTIAARKAAADLPTDLRDFVDAAPELAGTVVRLYKSTLGDGPSAEVASASLEALTAQHKRMVAAEGIAKSERDRRIRDTAIREATGMTIPGLSTEQLSEVLMKVDDLPEKATIQKADGSGGRITLAEALRTAFKAVNALVKNSAAFREMGSGHEGGGSAWDRIDRMATDMVLKSQGTDKVLKHAKAVTLVLDQHPDLYKQYQDETDARNRSSADSNN